jgi:hypothetical protein
MANEGNREGLKAAEEGRLTTHADVLAQWGAKIANSVDCVGRNQRIGFPRFDIYRSLYGQQQDSYSYQGVPLADIQLTGNYWVAGSTCLSNSHRDYQFFLKTCNSLVNAS